MNVGDLLRQSDSILIMGHHNADPDALCAMIAMRELYHHLRPDGTVTLACEDISKLAVKVVTAFGPLPPVEESISSITDAHFDLVVIVDTNSAFQLGEALRGALTSPSRTLVIDHHELGPDVESLAEHRIVESERSSTCELVVRLFRELDVPLSPYVSNLLLCGILYDTRRFYYADVDTLQTAIALIRSGADYLACLRSLVTQPDRSERIARLKAASRLKLHLIGDWIVVTSRVSAFEASACRSLLDLGADVAIVGGTPSKGVVRLSARSTSEFYRSTGINLGRDVMEPLGEVIGGEGGGHPNAAGANGCRNRDRALRMAVDLIRQAIELGPAESL